MTTMHHPSPQSGLTSFAIYEDPHDQEPMSPGELYEGDSNNSERSFPMTPMTEDVLHSIELQGTLDEEPQPYRSSYTSRKADIRPRLSSHYSLISAIPSESSVSSKHILPANEAGARAHKERPRFRNPESVRAMQMSSPPPLLAQQTSQERLNGAYKLATPSRNGRAETPVSRQSGSRRRSIRESTSTRPPPTPQQAPLVLLHVTILPMQVPYSHDIMTRIMPDWLVENYKLLEEKLQDIILMRRGLLIPHPRDEYDLLEERILESLELKAPRILPCGHFVPPEDDYERETEDDVASVSDENTGRGSRMSGGTLAEASSSAQGDHSMCIDCHRELKKPGKGVGAGTRKWDIKIYAANGLMRAAAWEACWNDMERCDVEIHPWVPEEVRKTLESRAREEQEADKRKQQYTGELQRQIQEAAAKTKILEEEANEKKRQEDADLQKSFETAAAALQRSIEEKAAEKKKFEEDLEVKLEEAKEAVRLELEARALAESDAVADRFRALELLLKEKERAEAEAAEASRQVQSSQIPLSTLLKNYVVCLLSDPRNFIILLLGAAVVYLSMSMGSTQLSSSTQMLELPTEVAYDLISTAITATMTATAYSTFTVTEVHTAASMQETAVPILEVAYAKIEVSVVEQSEDASLVRVSEDLMPTSPAIELIDSADESTPIPEITTEAVIYEPVEPIAQDVHNNNHTPSEGAFCIAQPVFQIPLSYCAASQF
jgi:hypothetical protein